MYLGPREEELGLSRVAKHTSIARPCNARPGSTRTGEYFVAEEPNSFGITSVDSCPGMTDYCAQDCYAIESAYREETREKLDRNLAILQEAKTLEGMTEKLREMIADYVARADSLKIAAEDRHFRIHWSGDFFSHIYALAWRTVILENPDIHFYDYTRSFQPMVNVLPLLEGIENLDLFISVDWQNVDRAREVLQDHSEVRVAYLVDYQEDADELVAILGREEFRQMACPENMYSRKQGKERRLPVISEHGGACSVCGYCTNKRTNWDVVFVKKHRQFRPKRELPFDDLEPVPVQIRPRGEQRTKIAQPVGELVLSGVQDSLF